MKKRNETPKGARSSRPATSGRDNSKSRPRTNTEGSTRSEGPRPRIEKPSGERGTFRPRRAATEKLFTKPSIKKSLLDKLAAEQSAARKPKPERVDRESDLDFDKPRGEFKPRREGTDRPFGRYERKADERGPRRDFEKPRGEFKPRREESGTDRPAGRYERKTDERGPRRDFDKPRGEFKSRREESGTDRPRDRYERKTDERGPRRDFDKPREEFKPRRDESGTDRPTGRYERKTDERGPRRDFDKPRGEFKSRREESGAERPSRKRSAPAETPTEGESRRVGKFTAPPRYDLTGYEDKNKNKKSKVKKHTDSDILRLNRYIANAGICSRREADSLIESGQIMVNGKVITEMGYKVKRSDTVKYDKKVLNPERSVYVLINKPKDYITTTEDPEERKTVLDLVAGACEERIYPVGRLDRNTTGLLLLTNDGELAEKLTHPSSNIKKVYQAELDRPITTEAFEALQAGLKLEDGFIKPDSVGIITPDAMVVGLEIHSGRNRIVRRMFEHLGYEVKKLDRTVFAGLNKKDLPRGKWRFLSEREVVRLKFMI